MNIVYFIVALALFVGGLLIMGYAFYAPEELRGAMFISGILAVGASLALPVHVLKRIDG